MAEIKLTNVGKSFRNEGKGGWIAAVSNVSVPLSTVVGPPQVFAATSVTPIVPRSVKPPVPSCSNIVTVQG